MDVDVFECKREWIKSIVRGRVHHQRCKVGTCNRMAYALWAEGRICKEMVTDDSEQREGVAVHLVPIEVCGEGDNVHQAAKR
jgi:hypothetical protein